MNTSEKFCNIYMNFIAKVLTSFAVMTKTHDSYDTEKNEKLKTT